MKKLKFNDRLIVIKSLLLQINICLLDATVNGNNCLNGGQQARQHATYSLAVVKNTPVQIRLTLQNI